MGANIKYRMLGASGQANLVWADAADTTELAATACSIGSIGTIAGDPDKLYIFNGVSWDRLDKPSLQPGSVPEYDGINPITLLAALKLLQPSLLELNDVMTQVFPYYREPAETMTTDPAALTVGMVVYDETAEALKVLKDPGAVEVDTITVTQGAVTKAGNITVTLNEVDKVVAVLKSETAAQVAAKILALDFDGWDAAYGDNVGEVVFTAQTVGTRVAPALTDTDETGVTGTAEATQEGAAATWITLAAVTAET